MIAPPALLQPELARQALPQILLARPVRVTMGGLAPQVVVQALLALEALLLVSGLHGSSGM